MSWCNGNFESKTLGQIWVNKNVGVTLNNALSFLYDEHREQARTKQPWTFQNSKQMKNCYSVGMICTAIVEVQNVLPNCI